MHKDTQQGTHLMVECMNKADKPFITRGILTIFLNREAELQVFKIFLKHFSAKVLVALVQEIIMFIKGRILRPKWKFRSKKLIPGPAVFCS